MIGLILAAQLLFGYLFVHAMRSGAIGQGLIFILASLLTFVLWFGFFIIHPNEAKVMQLLANKLKANDDFIKDDYRDDRHFTYKINPVTFTRAAGLSPAPPASAAVGINGYQDGYQTGINMDTKNETLGTKVDNHNDEIDTKLDTKPPDPIPNQDLIDILKDQLRVKDEQLERGFEQSKSHSGRINSGKILCAQCCAVGKICLCVG